ncbi:HAD family hydrolase [Tautonia marina]|uniref:HAD-IIB family hydrolase n=1 Tax=Tautonia marina TaxID=2653855 RepID=UPI0012604002|nr:HAD family hydrolase [Tautonia marina]
MRYIALAADYDGTLAAHGAIDEQTELALLRLKSSGRQLIMVTGRELDELLQVCPQIELFDCVVAENGGLIYDPKLREISLLDEPPPREFIDRLKERGVLPLGVGRVIVATWEPHQQAVIETIHEMGLELQVIFNKQAVMILPSGVNKASGLREALRRLGLSPRNVVSVGDAENDHAMLRLTECGVAVENAIASLMDHADWTADYPRGQGVCQLVDRLLDDDLASLEPRLTRHHIPLGYDRDDEEVMVQFPPFGLNVLIAGTSGSGKSTLVTGVLERLAERGYQACIVDPEGDYTTFPQAIVLGSAESPPPLEEVGDVLEHPDETVVVNLIGLSMPHRPEFFDALMPRLQELRARTCRPQWIVIDEAHHLLPRGRHPTTLPLDLRGALFITVHPESMAPEVLATVEEVWAVGEAPGKTLARFAEAIGQQPPAVEDDRTLAPGECVVWSRRPGAGPPRVVRSLPARTERRRHSRKYAIGELEPHLSFYYRGSDDRLNLRAQNLWMFLQIGEGVDEETWLHHLHNGDYSSWFTTALKDHELAEEARTIADRYGSDAAGGRSAMREAIARRYLLPT